MADLIGAMDRLWFHQIILLPEPTSLLPVTKNLTKQHLAHNMDSHRYQSSSIASSNSNQSSSGLSLDTPPPDGEETETLSPSNEDEFSSSVSTPSRSLLGDSDIDQSEEQREEGFVQERPTRLDVVARRARSLSSSPLTHYQKRPRRCVRHPEPAARLQKSMSCKSFEELELEEVKGFMDLGFKFKKEHLSPRLLRVVPGLQRLALGQLPSNGKDKGKEGAQEGKTIAEDEQEEEEDHKAIIRPYLSEAWLIRRPDSPLLNLRVPRVTAAADMKKHLRCWARTVASVVQQES